jgi:hypothetical protein
VHRELCRRTFSDSKLIPNCHPSSCRYILSDGADVGQGAQDQLLNSPGLIANNLLQRSSPRPPLQTRLRTIPHFCFMIIEGSRITDTMRLDATDRLAPYCGHSAPASHRYRYLGNTASRALSTIESRVENKQRPLTASQ